MKIFDHNDAYLWTIVILGLVVPGSLSAYAFMRMRSAHRRLERIRKNNPQEPHMHTVSEPDSTKDSR